ncbi:MAG: hypothetical protein CMJ51_05135 [Planctomycetaceae bacterium]|nr:hypothetical protein [Planctomycetaceae bacterium]
MWLFFNGFAPAKTRSGRSVPSVPRISVSDGHFAITGSIAGRWVDGSRRVTSAHRAMQIVAPAAFTLIDRESVEG